MINLRMFNQTERIMSNTDNSKKTVRDNEQMAADGLSISEIRKVVTEQLAGYGDADGMSVMKLVRLLGSAITGRKEEYKLSFNREEGNRWFVDFPNWPWKKGNLEMVCGADRFLDLLSEGKDRVTIIVKATGTDSNVWNSQTSQRLSKLYPVKRAAMAATIKEPINFTGIVHSSEKNYCRLVILPPPAR